MAIQLKTLRELVGQVGGLSDTALQIIVEAESNFIDSRLPDIPDDASRDSVLVDLVKNKLAYEGYTSSSIQGFSTSWTDKRNEIISRLEPSILTVRGSDDYY